ncbi:mediator complex subunit [Puccinia graminis f. sp. tritici]|uniref:Mediator of RNA polymerase II transcription subunit 5 n=1 Tax=Puccinia graminis f. sp. tritici TaxID=56615 RepID=A0A5B0N197_PUCGR|nr:mediator complex subunit [Puccinia graminis f. sp. tritici]
MGGFGSRSHWTGRNPFPTIQDHHPSQSTIYQYQLLSILHHLSPSTAKQLALNSSTIKHASTATITTSTTASSIIAYIFLYPGVSTLNSDDLEPQLILSRIISYALSRPANFIVELFLAAISLGNSHPPIPLPKTRSKTEEIKLK